MVHGWYTPVRIPFAFTRLRKTLAQTQGRLTLHRPHRRSLCLRFIRLYRIVMV